MDAFAEPPPEILSWLNQLTEFERAASGVGEVAGCGRPQPLAINLAQLPAERAEPLLDWMLSRGAVWDDDRAKYREGGSAGSFSLRLRSSYVEVYCGHYFSLRPLTTSAFKAALRRHPEMARLAA